MYGREITFDHHSPTKYTPQFPITPRTFEERISINIETPWCGISTQPQYDNRTLDEVMRNEQLVFPV